MIPIIYLSIYLPLACHLPLQVELELKRPLELASVSDDRGVTLDLFDGAHLDLDPLEIAAERHSDRSEPCLVRARVRARG